MSGMQNTVDEDVLQEVFGVFDKDGSGAICTYEFGSVARVMGFNPTDKEIDKVIAEFDLNSSGKLEFKEFKEWYRREKQKLTHASDELTKAFKLFDKNGDGLIDLKELKKIMEGFGQPILDSQIEDMIKAADLDKDGKINYTEFAKFICQPPGYKQPQSDEKATSEKQSKSVKG